MPRTTSTVRLSRALGIPLTPKAARYLERRPYPPGQHGRARRRTSDYKLRLLEKQRLRAQYDLSEAQLRLALARALRSGGNTGEALLVDLETRLDALVIEVAASSKSKTPFVIAAAGAHTGTIPPYLDADLEALRARLVRLPARAEIPVICDERLVIEFYSR